MEFQCPNCDESIVQKEGNTCSICLEWERKIREGDLTEAEKIQLIHEEAEGHYQRYKNM